MTFVGKILVFCIMILSVTFMAFSIATYSANKNWRKAYSNPNPGPGETLGVLEQQKAEKDNVARLEDERSKLSTALSNLRELKAQELMKLEGEAKKLDSELKVLRAERDGQAEQLRAAVTANETAQNEKKVMREELEVVRKELVEVHQSRDKHFGEVVRLTDQVNQMKGELERLQARQTQLAEQIVKQQKLIAYHGVSELSPELAARPPKVTGKVVDVNPTEKLVEISLGSDDGIVAGHELEVFRMGATPRYLAKVRVIRTSADRAVAKVVDGTLKGAIERDDNVASQLR